MLIELHQDTVLRLPDMPSAKLACLAGAIWVTRDGDRTDFILEAGMTYPFALCGTVLQALRTARLAIRLTRYARSNIGFFELSEIR